MWRESGKQMPFKEFATLYNSGGLDAYFQTNTPPINKKGVATPKATLDQQKAAVKQVACPKKIQNNATTYLQIAAVGFILLGAIYLISKKGE